MDTNESESWLDELVEAINYRVNLIAKFKTHKQRKAFIGDLANQIKTAVSLNTVPKNVSSVRKLDSAITRPNPEGKGKGFAVMTEGLSQKGDEVLGVGPSSANVSPINTPKNNRGMNSW